MAACVLSLRFEENSPNDALARWCSKWAEGVIWLVVLACCGFGAGVLYRFGASYVFLIIPLVFALVALVALYIRQVRILILFYSFLASIHISINYHLNHQQSPCEKHKKFELNS